MAKKRTTRVIRSTTAAKVAMVAVASMTVILGNCATIRFCSAAIFPSGMRMPVNRVCGASASTWG